MTILSTNPPSPIKILKFCTNAWAVSFTIWLHGHHDNAFNFSLKHMPVQKMIFWDLIQFHDMANLLRGHELHNLGRRLCGHYYYAFSFFLTLLSLLLQGLEKMSFENLPCLHIWPHLWGQGMIKKWISQFRFSLV